MHGRLAVACRLPICRNDRDLLRATAVIGGWNEYRSKSQRRKLTMEKKILLPELEPATFGSRVRGYTTDLSLLLQSAFDTIKFIN